MMILIIYIVMAFLWACYAVYRNIVDHKKFKISILMNGFVFMLNIFIFPYSLYYVIKHKKI